MPRRQTPRNPLFARRWFEDEVIILCIRWYLRYKLSYRNLTEMMNERGLVLAPSTILRWVVRYAEDFERRWRRYERPVGGSWRCDETYIKVRGKWVYLYRAVDGAGNTVEFYLSPTRDAAAAKAFFRKALKHHGQPRTITLDGFEPSHSALRSMGMRNEFNYKWKDPVKIRCCQRVKFRVQPMLGFGSFYNARRVIAGIELVQKIHKGQFTIPTEFGSNLAVIWSSILAA